MHLNTWVFLTRIRIGVKGIEISIIHATKSFSEEINKPHGHTLSIEVSVEGSLKNNSYIIDLLELERIVRESVEIFDKALVIPSDHEILRTLGDAKNQYRRIIQLDKDATLENIALEIAGRIREALRDSVDKIYVRIYEGNKYFAEVEIP